MKAAYILIVILGIALAGCGSAEAPERPLTEEPPQAETPPQQEQPAPQPAPQQAAAEQPPAAGIDAASKEVLDKRSKVKSYRYYYYGPPNDAKGLDISRQGSKVKITLDRAAKLSGETYYDTAYLDLSAKNAEAYCDRLQGCTAGGPYGIDYDLYLRPVPDEFVEGIASAKAIGEEVLEGRRVLVIEYATSDGKKGKMWADRTYGLPLKVILADVEYEYRSAQFNTVTEQEITHQP
ncbi:hypothetical protein HYY74_08360 [Candidatus Woesearchaeota archaeon]|nr:hypothetical protein [Candidatus Woesearchaeota archaeon]